MTPDLVDEMFGDGPEREEEEYYPGSKRKRREEPTTAGVEFIPDPWRENYTLKLVGGEERKMYPIGALANALGVSVQTIRYWTRKGYLPLAPFRLPSNMWAQGRKVAGRRLYTEPIIEATVDLFEKHGVLGALRIDWAKHPDLRIEIVETWGRIIANQPTAN